MDGRKFIWVTFELVVFGLIFYVLWWGLGLIALPQPFMKVAQVILILGAGVVVINALLSLIGKEFISWGNRNTPQ